MAIREVIFRGKRTDNGEWIEGAYSPFHLNFGEREEKPHIIIISDDEDIDGLWCEVIPETVGQYTGLTDKNGKKIFEGDIVKGIAYSVTKIGVIVWIDEISSFGVRYVNAQNLTAWENSSILRCVSMGKTDEFAAEVIGNIHDNPELLGGENNGINR